MICTDVQYARNSSILEQVILKMRSWAARLDNVDDKADVDWRWDDINANECGSVTSCYFTKYKKKTIRSQRYAVASIM